MSEQPIARYSFVPWLRQGLASTIENTDTLQNSGLPGAERTGIQVTVEVNTTEHVAKPVQLIGPGDITGIDPRAVVRTDPKHWVTDFEPNYLPMIEFYDEDFLWRYTPAAASSNRLRPWIALIVLTEDEFETSPTTGPLPAINLLVTNVSDVMPKLDEIWAWAHVHTNRDVKSSDGSIEQAITHLDTILNTDTSLAISRLLCPRKLKPNTAYHAFVIPTFETGRLTGLGQTIPSGTDGLASSWGSGQTQFPVYYQWYFRTSDQGDFEYLVRLLEPRVLDPRVGIRDMDVQDPGYGLPSAIDTGILGLEGALKTPDTDSTPWPNREPFVSDLTELVNLPADLKETGTTADPVVGPPIYGQWHALATRVQDTDNPPWIDQLNLDPRYRAAAGMGTLVIQTNQEELMNSAWRQIGSLKQVNTRLKWAQFAREISLMMFARHVEPAPPGQLLAMTSLLHSRILLGNATTARYSIRDSALPLAAVSPAFRRITRPRGTVMTRIAPIDTPRQPNRWVERINAGEITAAPPKTAPAGQISVNEIADTLTPTGAPGCLGSAALRPFLLIALPILSFLGKLSSRVGRLAKRLRAQLRQTQAAEHARESGLTVRTVREITARSGFSITRPGDPVPDMGSSGRDSTEATNFRRALVDLHGRFQTEFPVKRRVPLNLPSVREQVLTAIHPSRTVPARVLGSLLIPEYYLADAEDEIAPVMAYPDFPQPMYEPLRDISAELLIPNLNLIPQNTISLLETNEPFIEAYMVGLNHEMARELLWREYPTDQRGSYFRQFWDVSEYVNTDPTLTAEELAEKLRDIKPIHEWPRDSNLGDNNNRQFGNSDEHLVLVIRGDLLKRYPTAVIYAAEAEWNDDPMNERRRMPKSDVIKAPVFKAKIDPDITLLGFELTAEEAKGSPNEEDAKPGWFFAIQERPGEPRYGLDDPEDGFSALQPAHNWNELSWGHLAANQDEFDALNLIDLSHVLNSVNITDATDAVVHWGADSADMAYILLQVPVRIYVHASEMLAE